MIYPRPPTSWPRAFLGLVAFAGFVWGMLTLS